MSDENASAAKTSDTEALQAQAAAAYEKLDRKEYPELARRLALFTGNDTDYAEDPDFCDDLDFFCDAPYTVADNRPY